MKKLNDKYYLDSDSCNLVLLEKMIVEKGANKGKDYYKTIGYYGNLKSLYKSIIEKEIKIDLDLLDNIEKIVKLIDEIGEDKDEQ